MPEVTPHTILEKYEFYFLGLTFTLLGLSIQSVNFSSYSNLNTVIELLGWLFFGVSGVVGLSKIEYLPSLITIRNERDSASSQVSELQKIKTGSAIPAQVKVAQSGKVLEIDSVISIISGNEKVWSERLDRFGKHHEFKHQVQKYLFISGLTAVGIARAYAAILSMVSSS